MIVLLSVANADRHFFGSEPSLSDVTTNPVIGQLPDRLRIRDSDCPLKLEDVSAFQLK